MDEDPILTVSIIPPEPGIRYRRSLRNKREVILGWLQNKVPEGGTPSLLFRNGVIYSYGIHFPIAKHVRTIGRPDPMIFLCEDNGSSMTTKCHVGAVSRSISSGRTLHIVDDVLAKRRSEHLHNFDCILLKANAYALRWKGGRTNKGFYSTLTIKTVIKSFRYSRDIGLGVGLDPETPFPIISDWFREKGDDLIATIFADPQYGRSVASEVTSFQCPVPRWEPEPAGKFSHE